MSAAEGRPADAEIGFELPPLIKTPITGEQLALYAAASGDFNRIHLDGDYARSAGHPRRVAHGMLTMGIIGEHLLGWARGGSLRHLEVRFLAVAYEGDALICRARVVDRTAQALKLEVAAERADGTQVATGTAELLIPRGR